MALPREVAAMLWRGPHFQTHCKGTPGCHLPRRVTRSEFRNSRYWTYWLWSNTNPLGQLCPTALRSALPAPTISTSRSTGLEVSFLCRGSCAQGTRELLTKRKWPPTAPLPQGLGPLGGVRPYSLGSSLGVLSVSS